MLDNIIFWIMGYSFVVGLITVAFLFGYILGKRDRQNQILSAVIKDKLREIEKKVTKNANIQKKVKRRS